MSRPLRTIEDYELFLYSLPERYPSIRHSTLVLARRGATLGRVAGVEALVPEGRARLTIRAPAL